jgi:glycine cleavage system H protein
MFTSDPYLLKTIEYLTGVGFLVLFVLFWRYANGEAVPAAERVRAWSGQLSEWFQVPERVRLHPAHAWARAEAPRVFTVGLDDFAQQLVGPVEAVDLPAPGTMLEAGRKAWTLRADGKAVDMLAPISGEVVGVNDAVAGRAQLVNDDPYGHGWLLKVRSPRADAAKGLLSGAAARRWMARVADDVMATMTPELGVLAQDGGLPVHGIARGIDPEHWDDVARKFLEPEPVARGTRLSQGFGGQA